MGRPRQERRAGLTPLLEAALRPAPSRAFADVPAWWAAYRGLSAGSPVEAAVRGGAMADRLGWAFAAGYAAALDALIPDRDPDRPAALCVTEEGPPRPRSIEARFADGRVDGVKRFVTLGAHAEELYVLAREGERDGRPALALVRVARDAPGVTLEPLPATSFVPEIPHAAVRLEGAPAERLEGDGWDRWVKPFRTVEDAHVHLAAVAFLCARLAEADGPRALRERGAALIAGLAPIAEADPTDPLTHLALAGALAEGRALFEAVPDGALAAPVHRLLARDRRLLDVAASAREARRLRAWDAL